MSMTKQLSQRLRLVHKHLSWRFVALGQNSQVRVTVNEASLCAAFAGKIQRVAVAFLRFDGVAKAIGLTIRIGGPGLFGVE